MKVQKILLLAKDRSQALHKILNRCSPSTSAQMQSISVGFRNLRLATCLTLGLSLGTAAWSKPAIQSIDVSPNPLVAGQAFTISITASPDVTQGAVSVDFHPGKPQSLDFALTNQGGVLTGTAIVPVDFSAKHTDKLDAKVKVILFDANQQRDEENFPLDVEIPTISAVFSGSVLTVTGDNHDNTLVVNRDAAGTLLVNGGAVPSTGGLPTTNNTTLIQILGVAGNDVLTVDDANGPMPPANLSGGDGDDILTGSAAADVLDGGAGNDTLFGRDGNDTLIGGSGNDILNGGRGTDRMSGGDGDDQFVWNPGDGSDVIEGEAGNDTLVFNGANVDELVDLSANGQRLRFFRNVANITMDCDGIEQVIFHALGGADQVTVNNLTGTQVTNVLVDLSATGGSGDGKADVVNVQGTDTNDVVTINGSTNGVNVVGLSATVTVVGAESNLDRLVLNVLGGDDKIDASALPAGLIGLTLNGGNGNDQLIGSQGGDVINGGPGADVLIGGAGDDTFPWNPGDGSDVVEGQAGHDTLVFNGANIAEQMDLSANGQRLRFFRNVANITMDCNDIEDVKITALGGADMITVNDLTGTSVTNLNIDLASAPNSGVGDGLADTVIVNGTTNSDAVTVTGAPATGVSVSGLQATVNIAGSDPTLDSLVIDSLAGDDVVNASALQAGVINLMVDGGAGDDVLVGSLGDDVLIGGVGDDILEGGPGVDVLDGGPGNNVLIQ